MLWSRLFSSPRIANHFMDMPIFLLSFFPGTGIIFPESIHNRRFCESLGEHLIP